MSRVVDALAYLLPDLDAFSRSSWLLYGGDSSSLLTPVIVQTVLYVVLVSAIALFDLSRKNF
jgi:hypothetical protein